ncbi:Catechol 2,3-dioxygenase [Paenibacillus sp. 1_12]|uniref:VOC family protein n=1 Tax=Paenibacillus sp. 1_12 TaxID=1566278 RepID=UPI0008EF4BE6|nr:VOC family protein [Paenibacillus sp. 1_12]SFL74659.1 Catechol 2,3-dioxygenase [Paenibacillus sp. 1_12]
MTNSPITNRIGAVFIHVTDMPKAIQWYSELLGLPIHSDSHEGTIYSLQMEGGSDLLLDSNRREHTSYMTKTQLFFETKSLSESYQFVKEKGIEIVTEIEVHENISFFTFKDPDGNILMICEDKRKL